MKTIGTILFYLLTAIVWLAIATAQIAWTVLMIALGIVVYVVGLSFQTGSTLVRQRRTRTELQRNLEAAEYWQQVAEMTDSGSSRVRRARTSRNSAQKPVEARKPRRSIPGQGETRGALRSQQETKRGASGSSDPSS